VPTISINHEPIKELPLEKGKIEFGWLDLIYNMMNGY
jgi:hypothetical protein